jgi:hypothetical protein
MKLQYHANKNSHKVRAKMQEQLIIKNILKTTAWNLNVNAITTTTFPHMQRNAHQMFLLYILYILLKEDHQNKNLEAYRKRKENKVEVVTVLNYVPCH